MKCGYFFTACGTLFLTWALVYGVCWLLSVFVEQKRNVMAHAQKLDLVFQRNGRVHLYRRGCQFSRLLAAEVCGSAVVMLDRPCPIQCTTVLTTPSIRLFPLHFSTRAFPCATSFRFYSTTHDDRDSQLVTPWMPQGRSATRSNCVSDYQSLIETDDIILLFMIYRLLIGKTRCVISELTRCVKHYWSYKKQSWWTHNAVWRIINVIPKYTRTQLFSHKTTAFVFMKLLHVSTRSVFYQA